MANKQVAVFMGDDASPEVMVPTVDLLRGMNLGIDFGSTNGAEWRASESGGDRERERGMNRKTDRQ